MAAAEFVTNDRVSVKTGLDVGPLQTLASSANDGHLIYDGCLASLVLAGLASSCNSRIRMMRTILVGNFHASAIYALVLMLHKAM